MFQTIMVPLDGSATSEAALPIAARVARFEDATLVLVRVVNLTDEYWMLPPFPYPTLLPSVIDREREEAAAYLQRLAHSHNLAGLHIRVVVRFGRPATAILDTARSCNADLIVLSRSGESGLAHWIKGSVIKKIARSASMPILVLPEGSGTITNHVSQIAHPLRILVPLDGSTNARAALEPAASLLTALAHPEQKKALHLVRVVKLASRKHEKKVEDFLHLSNEIERARYHLRQKVEWLKNGYLVPMLARQRIPITWSIALDTDVASALLRVAEQGEDTEGSGVFGGCNLIAMATHGRTGLQRWIMGSIAERMLAATRLPLLIVRPPNVEAEQERNAQTAAGRREALAGLF